MMVCSAVENRSEPACRPVISCTLGKFAAVQATVKARLKGKAGKQFVMRGTGSEQDQRRICGTSTRQRVVAKNRPKNPKVAKSIPNTEGTSTSHEFQSHE